MIFKISSDQIFLFFRSRTGFRLVRSFTKICVVTIKDLTAIFSALFSKVTFLLSKIKLCDFSFKEKSHKQRDLELPINILERKVTQPNFLRTCKLKYTSNHN